jgi:hypothetical protein
MRTITITRPLHHGLLSLLPPLVKVRIFMTRNNNNNNTINYTKTGQGMELRKLLNMHMAAMSMNLALKLT